jgi:hypothetical protein
MTNSGKSLEQLVRQVEEIFLPPGFTVSANERVFDDAGNQLAEFDIQIVGKVGSTSFKWLIECRDRPSDGPAPGSWIEQLVGRRDRFNFSQVTAVSTTDFAEGAKEYARQKGVELRTVEKLTANAIIDWLRVSEVDATVNLGTVHQVDLIADSQASPQAIKALASVVSDMSAEREILVHTGTGHTTSPVAEWLRIIRINPNMFEGLEPNGPARKIEGHANYGDPNNRYQILTSEGPVDIVQIVFRAELSSVRRRVPVTRITQYSRTLEQEIISQEAHFEIEVADKVVDLALHNFGEKHKTHISVRLNSR